VLLRIISNNRVRNPSLTLKKRLVVYLWYIRWVLNSLNRLSFAQTREKKKNNQEDRKHLYPLYYPRVLSSKSSKLSEQIIWRPKNLAQTPVVKLTRHISVKVDKIEVV